MHIWHVDIESGNLAKTIWNRKKARLKKIPMPVLELQTTGFSTNVWWNSHFPTKGLESSNWNSHFPLIVWGSRFHDSRMRMCLICCIRVCANWSIGRVFGDNFTTWRNCAWIQSKTMTESICVFANIFTVCLRSLWIQEFSSSFYVSFDRIVRVQQDIRHPKCCHRPPRSACRSASSTFSLILESEYSAFQIHNWQRTNETKQTEMWERINKIDISQPDTSSCLFGPTFNVILIFAAAFRSRFHFALFIQQREFIQSHSLFLFGQALLQQATASFLP